MAAPAEGGEAWICVAAIAGAHGVRGAVRVTPFTETPEALEGFSAMYPEGGGATVELELLHPIKQGWAARMSGVDTREQAQELAGTRLYVPRESLGAPDEPESYYRADLIELTVIDTAGEAIGRVHDVADYGAGDLLELHLTMPVKGLGKAILLPFERAYVPQLDLAGGTLTVDLEAWLAIQAESGER